MQRKQSEIRSCPWCMGDGKDHGTLTFPVVRDCPRCEGSGRVLAASRTSATGRRRIYLGPAPRPGFMAARQQQLNENARKTKTQKAKKKDQVHIA